MTEPVVVPVDAAPVPGGGAGENEALAFKDVKERVGRSVERSTVVKVGVWSLTQGPSPDGTDESITLLATNTLTGTQVTLAPVGGQERELLRMVEALRAELAAQVLRIDTVESDINAIESDINGIESDINGLERDIRDCNC